MEKEKFIWGVQQHIHPISEYQRKLWIHLLALSDCKTVSIIYNLYVIFTVIYYFIWFSMLSNIRKKNYAPASISEEIPPHTQSACIFILIKKSIAFAHGELWLWNTIQNYSGHAIKVRNIYWVSKFSFLLHCIVPQREHIDILYIRFWFDFVFGIESFDLYRTVS